MISKSLIRIKRQVSPRYFKTLFGQQFGMSPKEYVISLRIKSSKELLMNEKNQVQDVAFMVGYSDVYHFSKLFKKKTGYTPTEYKREHRKQIQQFFIYKNRGVNLPGFFTFLITTFDSCTLNSLMLHFTLQFVKCFTEISNLRKPRTNQSKSLFCLHPYRHFAFFVPELSDRRIICNCHILSVFKQYFCFNNILKRCFFYFGQSPKCCLQYILSITDMPSLI